MSKLKKLLYCLTPVLIYFTIGFNDQFNDLKMLSLKLGRNEATATIVENPFYRLRREFYYDNLFHGDRMHEYVTKNHLDRKPKIRFIYTYKGKKFSDAYHFFYDLDGNTIEKEMADYISTINRLPVGSTFKIYQHENKSIPKDVLDNALKIDGIKLYFDSGVLFFLFTLSMSILLVYVQFKKRGSTIYTPLNIIKEQ